MKGRTAVGLVVLLSTAVGARAVAGEAFQTSGVERQVSLLGGVGPSTAGFGLSAERYFARSRMSVFGGVGYVPAGGGSGIAGGGGLRGFTGGSRQRGFAEVAFSPLGRSLSAGANGLADEKILYGPSVSLGYQLTVSSGVTVMVSAGIGLEVNGPDDSPTAGPVVQIAVGRTWRR